MTKCTLYRVIHRETGKDYVGISVDHKRRWRDHRTSANTGSELVFHRALRKHGADSFDWKVVAWCFSFEAAQKLERLARHLGMGSYNMTMGGEGVLGLTEESIAKMSAAHAKPGRRTVKGLVHSDQTKLLMRARRAELEVERKANGYWESKKVKHANHCAVCRDVFVPPYGKKHKLTCSSSCLNQLRATNMRNVHAGRRQ